MVQFDAVEIKPADGQSTTFPVNEGSIDLLAQQGENSASLLDGEEVAAGDYNWIRLHITASQAQPNASYIMIGDSQYILSIPSAAQTGLKLVSGFTVPENAGADFTIDFDLRKSITKTGSGDYKLRPALRLVNNAEVGHIAAEITGIQNCPNGDTDGPAIYVFEGGGVTPDDVDTSDDQDTDPVTTAKLTDDDTDGTYTGTAGFLTTGTYTVAFTCEAANDVSDADDNLTFEGSQDVNVQADQTVTYSHTVN